MGRDIDYQKLLGECISFHGHLCMGQVLGVRIAVKGLELAAAKDPRDLIVAVEVDRCLADAVLTVTGTRLGRRTLKVYSYGRMAASFLNTATGKAFRVHAAYEGPSAGDDEAAMRKILELPDEEVVAWEEITMNLAEEELPGKPKHIVACSVCGERVFDGKDRPGPKGPTCPACLGTPYYTKKSD